MTAKEYRALLDVDFDDVDIKDMPDMAEIKINKSLSQEERQKQYLDKVGNPYLIRIGNMKIKVRLDNNGISMEQAFENLLLNV